MGRQVQGEGHEPHHGPVRQVQGEGHEPHHGPVRRVQGEDHEPRHGPVPETTHWDKFILTHPEDIISQDTSATG